MENPFDDNISIFAVVFTRSVMAWNNVERSAQSILRGLSKGGIGAMAAITHLKPVPLADTLLTVADAQRQTGKAEDAMTAGHIVHFVNGMDVLRGYRNHYVHNLLSVGQSPHDSSVFQGLLHVWEAKKKLSYVQEDLTTDNLAFFMHHALQLSEYGEDLARHFRQSVLAVLAPPPPPMSTLKKPQWPPHLQKTRNYL